MATKKEVKTSAQELAEFITRAVSPYHTVEESKKLLEAAGFEGLAADKAWDLKKGGKYYVIPFKTSLFAFTCPKTVGKEGMRIHVASAHTDFPCLHVKPVAELPARGYMRVNTEIYGGPILNTWLDRPLSMAGRVVVRSKDIYAPEEIMIDFGRPVLTIPNLAIHYNREVNKGVELSKQNDMLPVLGMIDESLNADSYFIDFLAAEIGRKKEDILDFDLYVYNFDQPAFTGMKGELLSAPRLDNITSCHAAVMGLIRAKAAGLNIIGLFDNEEIGSETKQGADSALLENLLEKIYASFGLDSVIMKNNIMDGFLASADVAHAIHPAKGEKYDPVNNMRMGDGVTFKLSANQRYTYDTVAVACLQQLCDKYKIKYKKFVNNADMPGGGTLGPIISSRLPMKTVDIGVPILAMHSAREVMGAADQGEMEKLLTKFFE